MNSVFRLHKNLISEITILLASALSILFVGINIYILIFSIAVHELGHIIFALLNGAKPENFSLHGFGIELSFPGKTPSPNKLLLISAGGPLFSFLIAIISYFFHQSQLFIINISICVINLLPVYPLDGGNIFYYFMSNFISRKKLRNILKFLGKFLGLLISCLGVFILFISTFNISLIYMGLFIFFSAGNLQNPVIEVISANHSKIEKSSLFVIDSSLPLLDVAGSLPINSVGAIKDSNGKIISLVTPFYLYELASKNNSKIKNASN